MYSGASSASRGNGSHWISAGRLGRLRQAGSTWSVARPAAAGANTSAIATQLQLGDQRRARLGSQPPRPALRTVRLPGGRQARASSAEPE